MGVDPRRRRIRRAAAGRRPALHRGALSYHRRWPDPYPSVFGYHEVFHVYVCAAAACQYAAIARFIG
jgi:predicted membrane channel-forming protein YqfA (hemolysin III family)